MDNQELLLLQLLKFPVIIIKFLAKICSILTYLPNYLILYCIDKILFNQYLQSSRSIYIISWLPKLILLLSAFSLFAAEFLGIFWLLKLQQHSIYLQIGGMTLTLAGLLILMRKGYLSLLQKYNLFKLKSPVEHLELAFDFAIDLLGIFLWAINSLLIVRATKSWSYPYNKDTKYQFVKHITGLIRQSIMEYIQFFYVRIFFWLFWWRFADQRAIYLQQKANNNLLNIFVLLNLISLTTLLDILTIAILAVPCLIHPKRGLYITEMNTGVQKYKITLKMFLFISLHSLQIMICLICFVLCWKNSIQALKKCKNYSKRQELFGRQIPSLLFEFAVKLPYVFSLSIIFLSVYKYKRLKFMLKNRQGQEQSNDYTVDKIKFTFKCFGQLFCDLFYFIIALIATILKPWRVYWFKYLINQQYILDHDFIIKFFVKNLEEALVFPFCILLSILVFLYDLKKPLKIYNEAKVKISQKMNKKQKESAAPSSFIPQKQLISADSLILSYAFICLQSIIHDLPHIPFSMIYKGTFLHLYMPKSEIHDCTDIMPLFKHSYYKQSCLNSANIQIYKGMYTRMKASGILTIRQEYLFWKYAHKNQRIKMIQKILRAVLPTKSVVKIYNKIENQTNFSEISNEYWTNYQITIALFNKLIFLIIQIIVSIIGVCILLPLTLWRIPTFIMLYSHHRDRTFFFSILGKIYKQMGRDLLFVPLKIIALLIAPRMTTAFILKTSFQYGPSGLQTFEFYQKKKAKYLLNNIYATNFRIFQILIQCILIQLCWIRLKSMRATLGSHGYTIRDFYRMLILQTPSMSSLNLLIQPDQQYFNRIVRIHNDMREVIIQFIIDIPYLFIILIIFITMPWRINYIIKTVKQMREDASQRKSFFKLLKNILKDYACIFMSIFLIFSGFKTKRGLQLIRRNFRLNFFIGFLQYSYFQTLVGQMKLLMFIYRNITCLIIAALFGWTRANLIVKDVMALYRKKKQQQQSALSNQKIYDNTVKSGKQLQILHKMGYYNYITVTSFLTLPQIIKLRRVDRLNYSMSQRQQIWFMKWQTCFNKNPSQSTQAMEAIDFQQKCKQAYIASRYIGEPKTDSYNYITGKYFRENVVEKHVDITQFVQQRFPISVYNRLFKNYEYSVAIGYGPQNELPQEENQDPQFLRLTNQVRRPIVDLDENTAWIHLFYIRLSQFLVQKIHRYFRQDDRRRVKQLVLLLAVASIIIGYLTTIWLLWSTIFCINSLIGVKLLIIFYSHSFAYLMFIRCSTLYNGWVSLIPFNLYTDCVNAIKYLRRQIYSKILVPSGNFLKKVFDYILDKLAKIWKKITQKGDQAYDVVSRVAQKAAVGTIYYTKLAYEKVVRPLYIKIADLIRKCRDSLVSFFKFLFSSLKKLFVFSLTFFKSIYQGVAFVFSNINKLYYVILQKSMTFLLKFGILGNLIFTLFGLILMTLPTLLYFFAYPQRWYLVVSTIHTMVLIVFGYKHLNKIKANRNSLKTQ